jgi:hypothetical protein
VPEVKGKFIKYSVPIAKKMRKKDGGAEGDRTPDLRNAIATLSQLSYGPVCSRI